MIYGSIVTTTKAFNGVEIKIDPQTQRIFAKVRLRWWAKIKRMNRLRRYWITKAEKESLKFVPVGFKLLIYYEGGL
jgi:hypothetical protein